MKIVCYSIVIACGISIKYVRYQSTQALVNVPAVSDRAIRYDFAACKTTLDSRIQV